MKTYSLNLLLAFAAGLFILVVGPIAFEGCTTSQQTVANKTIGAAEVSAKAAYDSYCTLVIQGTVSTNSLPTVAAAYNQFQADAVLSATIASQGTNALQTTNLITDFNNLSSVISTAKNIP